MAAFVTSTSIDALRSKVAGILEHLQLESYVLWGAHLSPRLIPTDDSVNLILSKFLRARDNDVEAAAEMLQSTINWRIDVGIDEFIIPEDMAHIDITDIFDRENRPVILTRLNRIDEKMLSNIDLFIKYRAKLLDLAIAKIIPLSLERGQADKFVIFHDFAGTSIFGSNSIRKAMGEVTKNFYPDWRGCTILANFSAFADTINWFLPANSKANFVTHAPGDSEKLFQLIKPGDLMQEYGGLKSTAASYKKTEPLNDSDGDYVVVPANSEVSVSIEVNISLNNSTDARIELNCASGSVSISILLDGEEFEQLQVSNEFNEIWKKCDHGGCFTLLIRNAAFFSSTCLAYRVRFYAFM